MRTYFSWLRELAGINLDLACAKDKHPVFNKLTEQIYCKLWDVLKQKYGLGNF